MKVLCVGEPLATLTPAPHTSFATANAAYLGIGGAELNVAIHLARLGVEVAYAGAVGADPFGVRIREALAAEGIDAAVERHALHGRAMLEGVQGLGLGVFGDLAHKMNNVVAVEIPEALGAAGGDAVRGRMLDDFGIEIGTSFGPLHGKVWRIGTMGFNARKDAVLTTLAALEQVLRSSGVAVPAGGGVDAALAVYR